MIRARSIANPDVRDAFQRAKRAELFKMKRRRRDINKVLGVSWKNN